MTILVQFKPIPIGRSYVVWGTGTVGASHASVTVELDAFDLKHRAEFFLMDR